MISNDELAICTNSEHGYEIKYPKDWHVVVGENETGTAPILEKSCRDGIHFNAVESYPNPNAGRVLVRKLAVPYSGYNSNSEYIAANPGTVTYLLDGREAVWVEKNSNAFELLSFQNGVVWHVSIKNRDEHFATIILENFRYLEN